MMKVAHKCEHCQRVEALLVIRIACTVSGRVHSVSHVYVLVASSNAQCVIKPLWRPCSKI